jgi:hypothetical protein
MSLTLINLRHHKHCIAQAMVSIAVIGRLEQALFTQPTEMVRIALEQEDDLIFGELGKAEEALQFCHALNITSEVKRQRIARIACIRLGRMARDIKGVRLP